MKVLPNTQIIYVSVSSIAYTDTRYVATLRYNLRYFFTSFFFCIMDTFLDEYLYLKDTFIKNII